MRSPYDLRSPSVIYSSENEEQEGKILKGRAPARFSGIPLGHQPGAEGEGREKGLQAVPPPGSPPVLGPLALSPPRSPPHAPTLRLEGRADAFSSRPGLSPREC